LPYAHGSAISCRVADGPLCYKLVQGVAVVETARMIIFENITAGLLDLPAGVSSKEKTFTEKPTHKRLEILGRLDGVCENSHHVISARFGCRLHFPEQSAGVLLFHQVQATVRNDQVISSVDRHVAQVLDFGLDCEALLRSVVLQLADGSRRNINRRDMKAAASKIEGMPSVATAEIKDATVGCQQLRQLNNLRARGTKCARPIEVIVNAFPERLASLH
jgi:hypothetical protein